MNENTINQQFLNEIKNPSSDLVAEYSEIFIDGIIQSKIIKEIPIIKSIIGVATVGISVRQYFMAKKIVEFIKTLNDGSLSEADYNRFRHKIDTDYNFGQKVAEKLLVMIDNQVEINQTKITANLFKAFIKHEITFDELSNILISLNNLHPLSYDFLFELERYNFKIQDNSTVDQRKLDMENLVSSSGLGMRISPWSSGFQLNDDGIKLFELGIKPLKNQ